MKHALRLILIVILLSGTNLLWAAESLRVHIIGLQDAALKNAQDRLGVAQQDYGAHLTTQNIQDFFNKAPDNIRKAIEPYGYFKTKVQARLIHHDSEWLATFNVIPGPPLLITHLDMQITGPGKNNPELQKFIQHFPLERGQPLLIDAYNQAQQMLFQIANNQGYLKATLDKKEIIIDLNHYTSTVTLRFNTGKRYYFGTVNFTESPFAPEFLHRFVTFHDEEPFSSQKLLKFQQDLGSSQYFQQVLVNPEFNKTEDYHVPILVETSARKSQQYDFGIGYGTFTGPRFTAESNWRRVTNTGQHFNLQLKLSPVLSGLAAKYFIPGKNPLSDQYTLGANIQQFMPRNGRSFSETLSAGYVKSLREWQHTLTLNYLRERFTVNNNPWTSSHLLYPAYSISRIKSDDLINTRSGSAINFTIQGANENVLSQVNFIQSEIKAKYIMSPTEMSRVIVRGDLGYTTVKDLQKLPLTLQFFAGGPNSVRGYRYDSMGPGRYLKVGSVELQHRLYGNWSAGIFYDAGIAADHFNTPYQHSRGAGVIYNSIIGPIKIYVARADSTPGKPYRVDFTIGPDF
jgi:translocation and assembly module TamA